MIEPFAVILPSAGQSERFGSDIPKQYCKIDNQLVINYSLDLFLKKIKNINFVLTAFKITVEELKSKENLIF